LPWSRNALLFDAKFRSRTAYESHFGPFEGADDAHPTGHWQAPGGSNYPRLIINGDGRVWLFYRCGGTECPYGPAGSGLQRLSEDPEKTWQATLEPRVGAPLTLRITEDGPERLSVEVRGQPVAFAKTPPPVDPAPPAETLAFLGSFAKLECKGQHARLHQLWLWRQDTRLFAVGVFSTLLAGQRADFVSPVVLGEATRQDDAWRFEWQTRRHLPGRDGRARAAHRPGGVAPLVRDRPDRPLLRRRHPRLLARYRVCWQQSASPRTVHQRMMPSV
jgi:hypothetical protein